METRKKDLDKLQKKLEDLYRHVSDELHQIHKDKLEIQKMKTDIINSLCNGYYIRDDQRIIISAPEIIIGDVDKNGILLGNNKNPSVTIRSNNINIEGVDTISGNGSIKTRASKIIQTAVNPGLDGFENEVTDTSQIVSQAQQVVLASSTPTGKSFLVAPDAMNGIQLQSDSTINIGATKSKETLKTKLNTNKAQREDTIKELTKSADNYHSEIDRDLKRLGEALDESKEVRGNKIDIRRNFLKLDNCHKDFEQKAINLNNKMSKYYTCMAELNENKRIVKNLTTKITELNADANFLTTGTNTSITLASENLTLNSVDGDGNIRTNKGAKINLNAKEIKLSSRDKHQCLIDDSSTTLASKTIRLDSGTLDNNHKKKIVDNGRVEVFAQDFIFEAMDYTLENKGTDTNPHYIRKDADALKGRFTIRTQNMEFNTANSKMEPDPDGSFIVNAKKMELKSVNYKKNGNQQIVENTITPNSSLSFISEKVKLGRDAETLTPSYLYNYCSEMHIEPQKCMQIKHGKDSYILLNKNELLINPSAGTTFFTRTSMEDNLKIKGDTNATMLNTDGLDVKTSFKCKDMQDVVGVVTKLSKRKFESKENLDKEKKDKEKKDKEIAENLVYLEQLRTGYIDF